MPKKLTTKVFKDRSKKVHNNYYDYSKSVYTGANNKLIITCPIHGDFEQIPYSHLRGHGCVTCSAIKNARDKQKWTTKTFKKKVEEIHPQLDFGKSVFKFLNQKIDFDCPIHKEQKRKASDLLKNKGCPKCGKFKKPQITREEWIKRFKKVGHKNISYDKVPESFTSAEKITFVCNIHGDFQQTPATHCRGSSCRECGFMINGPSRKGLKATNPRGWKDTSWKKAGENSENFDSYKIYVIRCWDDKEEFYKVGKTFTTVKKRFKDKKRMPYNWEILRIFEGDAKYISISERKFQKNLKLQSYTPLKEFKGMFECFSKVPLAA